MEELLTSIEATNEDMRTAAKKIKRRLPDNQNSAAPLTFAKSVQTDMAESLASMDKVVRVFRLVSGAASQLLAVLEGHQPQDVAIPVEQLNEVMLKALEKLYGKADDSSYKQLSSVVAEASKTFKHVCTAMENGEYDFDGTVEKCSLPPVVHRASAVKGEFAEVDNLKGQLQSKEEALHEMKILLKSKQEDLGQSVLKVQVLEKKQETASKEADDRIDRIQQRLDEVTMALKQKEKEHEDSVDALQADIDASESEKAELQKKLKDLSKKSLFAGLAKQMVSPETSEPVETPAKEGGMAARQIACQRELIRNLNLKIAELNGEKLLEEFKKLPALEVPQVEEEEVDEELLQLRRKGKELVVKSQKVLVPRLVDLTKVKKAAKPRKHLEAKQGELVSLQRQVKDFEHLLSARLSSRQHGGQAPTDFGAFATAPFLKALSRKTTLPSNQKALATLSFHTTGPSQCVPLQVSHLQFQQLHSRLSAF